MKRLMFGAMMAGLLGLAGAGSTTAQVVQTDGWWSTEYGEGYAAADRGRRNGRPGPAARVYDGRNMERDRDGRVRERGRDGGYVDDRYYDRDDGYRSRGVEVRRDGRVGVRLPGRVMVRVRPTFRGRRGGMVWNEVDWNVRFRFRNDRHYERNGFGKSSHLKKIVGKQTERRLKRHRDRMGLRGSMTYRWVDFGRRGIMMQVRAGRAPLAELIDFNGDGYVDVVRLSQGLW